MSDVDELLRADGRRWRGAQPAPPEPDMRRIATARALRWQPLAAAAAALVVLVGAAVIGLAATHRGHLPTTGPGSPRPSGPVPLDRLVIRDGDLIATSGQVLALPGKPVRFCPPTAFTLGPPTPDGEVPPYCTDGVTLIGADLRRLAGRVERAGAVWGDARIEGRYSRGTVQVTAQGPPNRAEEDPSGAVTEDERPPCAAPPGGWQSAGTGIAGSWQVQEYIQSHPDRFGQIEFASPNGDRPDSGSLTEVVVVGAVDPVRAERELRTMYSGNLCVFRVAHSVSEVFGARSRLGSAASRTGTPAYGITDYHDGTVRAIVVMVDESAYQMLRSVDRGTGILDVRPWLWPVGR
jgi:hypothetical protein